MIASQLAPFFPKLEKTLEAVEALANAILIKIQPKVIAPIVTKTAETTTTAIAKPAQPASVISAKETIVEDDFEEEEDKPF